MMRTLLLSFAASLLLAAPLGAATRPRYGGTLRVELASTPRTLLPAQLTDQATAQSVEEIWLSSLIYEPLTTLAAGAPQPCLAASWEHDAEFKHWRFHLRPGVRFHGGAELAAVAVADSLRASGIASHARVTATGDMVFFDSDDPLVDLPLLLAQPRYAITGPMFAGQPAGTGPFQLVARADSQHLTLAANDAYWGGRPYLDSVQFTFGQSEHQQALDLELGKADAAEVALDDARSLRQQNLTLASSQPVELVALVFTPGSRAAQQPELRSAISASVDRRSIWSVLLQKSGAPSAALLPQWLSGYSFLFPLVSQGPDPAPKSPPLVLAYDFSDPLLKLVAERISVNARQSGIVIQAVGQPPQAASANADLFLLRLPFSSTASGFALAEVVNAVNAAAPGLPLDASSLERTRAPEALYNAERKLLAGNWVAPVAHLPLTYGLGPQVRDWSEPAAGGLPLANVWIAAAQGHP